MLYNEHLNIQCGLYRRGPEAGRRKRPPNVPFTVQCTLQSEGPFSHLHLLLQSAPKEWLKHRRILSLCHPSLLSNDHLVMKESAPIRKRTAQKTQCFIIVHLRSCKCSFGTIIFCMINFPLDFQNNRSFFIKVWFVFSESNSWHQMLKLYHSIQQGWGNVLFFSWTFLVVCYLF